MFVREAGEKQRQRECVCVFSVLIEALSEPLNSSAFGRRSFKSRGNIFQGRIAWHRHRRGCGAYPPPHDLPEGRRISWLVRSSLVSVFTPSIDGGATYPMAVSSDCAFAVRCSVDLPKSVYKFEGGPCPSPRIHSIRREGVCRRFIGVCSRQEPMMYYRHYIYTRT